MNRKSLNQTLERLINDAAADSAPKEALHRKMRSLGDDDRFARVSAIISEHRR